MEEHSRAEARTNDRSGQPDDTRIPLIAGTDAQQTRFVSAASRRLRAGRSGSPGLTVRHERLTDMVAG